MSNKPHKTRKVTIDDLEDLDEEYETYIRLERRAEFKQMANALGNTATETYKGIKLEVKNLKEKISHTATIQFKNGRGEAIIVIRFEPSEKDYEWWHKKMIQDLEAETNDQFIDNVKFELEYWVYWFMVEQDFFRRAKEGGFKRGMPFKGEKGEEEND